MKKLSEQYREAIGGLTYDMQLFQIQGNDDLIDKTQEKIDVLRCKLQLVEETEPKQDNKDDD